MKQLEGDLIALGRARHFDVIVHGCNCFHTMGAGIAKAIKTAFPEAVKADQATPRGDRAKLGTISVARAAELPLTIVNAYTQFHWRGAGRKADYDAISGAFSQIARQFPKHHIGYPLISAGLAGGDWRQIAPRIDAALAHHDHTLVTLPGHPRH